MQFFRSLGDQDENTHMGNNKTVKVQPTIILTGRQDCSVHFFTLLVSAILGKEEEKDEVQVFNAALREILDYLT